MHSIYANVGPGKVLTGLIRRIDRSIGCTPLQDPQDLKDSIAEFA